MIGPAFRLGAFAGIFLLAVLQTACGPEHELPRPAPTLTPYPPFLYIGLSDAASPLPDLVSGPYETESAWPAPRFVVGNDETLLADLEQGVLEAVIVHHLPPDTPHWFSPIALDGVVFLAHPDIGIESLSRGQIQAIFGGSVVSWETVGGPDLPIKLYSREPGSGALAILQDRIMENVPTSSLAQIAPGDDYMRQAVASSSGAIGYSMLGSTDGQGVLLIDDNAATVDTVGEQLYPLTTPIYFVTRDEPEGELREFLAWLQSPDGQNVLGEKYGQVR
ncbi:MAG: substrate-binding domain-containing protein [Chloroflexota bacterium]|nr:MAG: substrate-binding domain-containing protein [Chloroflexota bacterium]